MTYYCRANDTDYDGDTVVEVVNISGRAVVPHVPAWEEWSRPTLAGPFAGLREAEAALDEMVARHDGVARYYMPERDCPAFD